jgi:serine/threonine protein kinase/serine phosphatase RsbU (regulator of sigma subunit)
MSQTGNGGSEGRAAPTGSWESSGPGADDPRVIAALEEYASALKAGQAPDRAEFLARHPEVAAALAECLEGLDLVRTAVPGRGAAAPARVPAAAGVEPGTSLGDFRVVREVGRGGMGVVYEAVQLSLGRRVALKVLPPASTLDPRQLQRFKNEARAAARLHHTNIVPVFATGCERGVYYYAMQLIEGQTLAALIGELRRETGRDPAPAEGRPAPPPGPAGRVLSEGATAAQDGGDTQRPGPYRPQAVRTWAGDTPPGPAKPGSSARSPEAPGFFRAVAQLGLQAAEALEHAHQLGIVHRDIKPGNLLVEGEPGVSTPRARLWVTDFGLAYCRSQAGLTMTGGLAGTLRYMSPEQALALPVPIDHRTDIYSLGVTLYELLTLEPVFPGRDRQELLRQIAFEEPRPPWRLNPAIPTELETIILKAMEKNPADRYATAQDVADDLERFLKEEPIRASLLTQQAINAILRIPLEPISFGEQLHRILGLILELPWLSLERKGSIYLADEGAKVLVGKAQVGMPPEALSACAQVPFGTCLCGRAIAAKEVVFASCLDARHSTRYPGIAPHGHYCVPICSGERPIGLLNLYVREGHQRLPAEEHFLHAVADVLAGIIGHQQTQERLREQLRALRQGLAPKAMPRVAGFRIAGRLATAEQGGGDCFDFIALPRPGQERLGVVIAEARGPGTAAALLMAETRASLRALALTCSDVGTLLSLTNRLLARRDPGPGHFVTLLLMELDPLTRSLVYASAGHCPGQVLDRHGHVKAVLASTGCPLGLGVEDEVPAGPTVPLDPGDLVFLFTDGIVEGASAEGKLFGLDRALGVVRAQRHETPEGILEALFQAVGDFCEHQFQDDMTAVVLKAEGAA